MEVVLDSNVFFRMLISGGDILKVLFNETLVVYAPELLRTEFSRNKAEILSKSKLPENDFNELVSLVFKVIEFIPSREYDSSIPKAKELLGTHKKDIEFIALCLAKNLKLWTYESLLFDIGFGVSTKQISDALSEEIEEESAE